jgi:hypothetical protein
MQANRTTILSLSALAIASALALSACGGGGGGSSAAAPAVPASAPPVAPAVTVSGSAAAVTADPLAGLLIPQDFSPASPGSFNILSESLSAANQTAQSNGAYTKLAIDSSSANVIDITSGEVDDVAGNGDFAIGRWTNGVTTSGTLTANQGVHYVVGKPLDEPPTSNLNTWTCTLIAATKPTAVSGTVAPGSLNSATAVVVIGGRGINSITATFSVGSDLNVPISETNIPVGGLLGDGNSYSLKSEFMGSDAANPLLAIGYAVHLPATGDVNGVAVLQCHDTPVI